VAMEDGAIREVGRHDELMERRGFYYEMVDRQRQSFGEPPASPVVDKNVRHPQGVEDGFTSQSY
jgi:hypothetical protein